MSPKFLGVLRSLLPLGDFCLKVCSHCGVGVLSSFQGNKATLILWVISPYRTFGGSKGRAYTVSCKAFCHLCPPLPLLLPSSLPTLCSLPLRNKFPFLPLAGSSALLWRLPVSWHAFPTATQWPKESLLWHSSKVCALLCNKFCSTPLRINFSLLAATICAWNRKIMSFLLNSVLLPSYQCTQPNLPGYLMLILCKENVSIF